MFRNPNNPNIISSATKHHQMCAMRYIQTCKRTGNTDRRTIGGYVFRGTSSNSGYLVPKNSKETWSEVLFFNI